MTIELNFGDHVKVSRSSEGDRAHFVLPPDERPSAWPESISLPELGPWLGSLENPDFVRAIKKDADGLRARLERRRKQEAMSESQLHNLPELARIYFRHSNYRDLSLARQKKNARSVDLILKWSAARGDPDVRSLNEMDVDDFLDRFNDEPFKRLDLRATWSALFRIARYAGWITASPLERGRWTRPETVKPLLWSTDDVNRYAKEASDQGQPGLAALIHLLFVTGQRIGDLRTARWDDHLKGGRLYIKQNKTQAAVRVPIAGPYLAMLEAVRKPGSPYLFHDEKNGKPFTEIGLSLAFRSVRDELSRPGDRHLLLRAMRHSCITDLFSTGASVPDVASVTGHKLSRIHEVLECYVPDRHGMAEASVKRAHVARGGSQSDFDHMEDSQVVDTWGGRDPKTVYNDPAQRKLARLTGEAPQIVPCPGDPRTRENRLVNHLY